MKIVTLRLSLKKTPIKLGGKAIGTCKRNVDYNLV